MPWYSSKRCARSISSCFFFPAVATSSAAPILFMRLGPIRSPFRDRFSVSSVHGVFVGHTSYTFCPRAKIGILVRPPTLLSLLFVPPPPRPLCPRLYSCISVSQRRPPRRHSCRTPFPPSSRPRPSPGCSPPGSSAAPWCTMTTKRCGKKGISGRVSARVWVCV